MKKKYRGEVIVKMQKIGGRGPVKRWCCRVRSGGQGGCIQRIEVIVKMQKNRRELRGSDQGSGIGRGGSMVGVVGDVGYGGCKPRIEGIDKCT